MTLSSPDHAMAYARICDLLRTAAADRRVPARKHRRIGAASLRWLRAGQLGGVRTCTDC